MGGDGRVRLAMIGCGAVSRMVHVPSILRTPGVELSVLCDLHRDAAELLAAEFGLDVPISTDITSLAGTVDAASVAVPPKYHAEICIALLEQGIDVLCEKPIAMSSEEGRAILEAAERNERVLAVGHHFRFHPNNRVLRQLLAHGGLGTIEEVVGEMGARLDWGMTSGVYYDRGATLGGVFFDAGIHVLDRIVWLFGDIRVESFEDDSYGGVESNALMRGTLDVDGRSVPVRVETSWTHKLRNALVVRGSEGTAEVRFGEPEVLYLERPGDAWEGLVVKVAAPQDVVLTPGRAQMADLEHAIRTRTIPHASAGPAITAVGVVERSYAIRTRMSQPWVDSGHEVTP